MKVSMQPDTPTQSQKPPRYWWLLPLVMLFAAALACDEPYNPPPKVGRVEADIEIPGKVYAQVGTFGYESDDYGVNWRTSEHVFAENHTDSYKMNMNGETLYLNERAIWSFPRPVFRGIFYDSGKYPSEQRLETPYGDVSNSQQGDTLYVAMGTEGVLAFKSIADASTWTLSAKGIHSLSPLPLTITNSFDILGVVGLALLMPPFALIHAYLLSRIWVYLLPAPQARRAALMTTAGLVVMAIMGIVYWLTNERTDLYQVIGVLTVITVIVGVSLTVYMATQRQVSDYTRNRLAVAALLLSLIVPGGVAAIFAMWWLVFGLVFAYWAYQRVYHKFRGSGEPTAEGRVQRWQTDRLALETMVNVLMVLVGFGVASYAALIVLGGRVSELFIPLLLLITLYLTYKTLHVHARRQAHRIIKPKPDLNATAYIELESRTLARRLTVHTVMWIVLAAIASGATFFGQAWAYGWFTSLLKGR
jgi:hypothetical protein